MAKQDNLASKLCSILALRNKDGSTGNAQEWRVLGNEKDGSIILTWITIDQNEKEQSHLGLYSPHGKISRRLKILYSFSSKRNIIQASVNESKTLIAFVTKEIKNYDDEDSPEKQNEVVYHPYIVETNNEDFINEPYDFGKERTTQIMVQFLYRKNSQPNKDRMLLLIHQEVGLIYNLVHEVNSDTGQFCLDGNSIIGEIICQSFSWAQWEPKLQTLFYIHYRTPVIPIDDLFLERVEQQPVQKPTLSALQFHDELPHETVLNIPLSLPNCSVSPSCNIYEDDCIPLRVHDCSLDLLILTEESTGMLCICHHYVYQPSMSTSEVETDNSVHFAYSVTVLHHGCVVHCVVPKLSWEKARTLRLTFVFHGDHHMLISVPGLFTHILDIGIRHTPSAHIVAGPCTEQVASHLVPMIGQPDVALDIVTLDIMPLKVESELLIEAFKSDSSLENRAAILHYFLVHEYDMDVVFELMNIIMSCPLDLAVSQLLQEFLLGSAFASVYRCMTQEAGPLLHLLPVTTLNNRKPVTSKVSDLSVGVSHELLFSSGMALLSPSQRLRPYCSDMWTRLWDLLERQTQSKPRFQSSQVADKLLVSLVCYQPEALSRCTTPMSPCANPLTDLNRTMPDSLPFEEMESCTASKQEHVISVNLRELSMHLVKHSAGPARWLQQSSMAHTLFSSYSNNSGTSSSHVHAVATRYATGQLEQSRRLCLMLCQIVGLDTQKTLLRGFQLIDHIPSSKRYELFIVLERYVQAVETLAFPLPQGFSSFFCLLGYHVLPFETFLQYVRRSVFELQVDVMKYIMAETEDTTEGITRKLGLLSVLPRSRARRLLANWPHPVSLMLRAREHTLHILSGEPGGPLKHTSHHKMKQPGLDAFPSAERLSPLDTFLDLLTAKASLHELDFNLLIEATITSTQQIL